MAQEPSLAAVGTLLNGTYRLERLIAEGGMGLVYEASHVRLPRRFAVKLLARPGESSVAQLQLVRFRREAEIASTLAHPHIVEVFDYQVSESGAPSSKSPLTKRVGTSREANPNCSAVCTTSRK